MDFDKPSYFRAQAEKCFHHAEETADKATKLGWLTLAEEWLLLAAEGRQDALSEASDYPALREVYTH
jgi:hypothetical protein